MLNQPTSGCFFTSRHRNTPTHIGGSHSVSPYREDFPSTRDGERFTVVFWLEANAHAPLVAFQLCGGMESYASFFKQHAMLVKGLHQMGFKSSPQGL